MRSMTIGKKLFLGFGAVIGLTAMLGLIALARLGATADGVERIASFALPNIYSANKLTAHSKEQKVLMLSHIASSSATQMASFDTDLAGVTNKLAEELKAYEKANISARDREFVARLTSANEKVMRAWIKVLPLSRASKTKQALDLWTAEAVPAAEGRAKVLEEIADANKASGDADADAATKAASAHQRLNAKIQIRTQWQIKRTPPPNPASGQQHRPRIDAPPGASLQRPQVPASP